MSLPDLDVKKINNNYVLCSDGNPIFIAQGQIEVKSKFKSLIIEKDFEPENPKKLEELDESSCKWPIGHPEEESFYFCGRSSLKDFSYCKLHLLYAYQPKGKKEEPVSDKDEETSQYIEKKINTA